MRVKNKIKGYTLVELLIGTGVLSLAAIGVYTVAMVASDWRKSSQEVKALNMTMKEIDNSTSTTGSYTGITLSSLSNYSSGINSALQLNSVVSPSSKVLNFVYKDMSPRICNDFANKMLTSSNNVGAIINGKQVSANNLKEISSACEATGGLNDLTIVLNKTQNDYTITDVVASINPPSPPLGDPPNPSLPVPQTPTTVPGFVPSTANPITYPLITGTPPTFGPIVGGGGPINVTSPSSPMTPTVPGVPTWNPPPVYKPPATPGGIDEIDTNPNPPPPRPKTFSKTMYICQSGYMWEHAQNSANHCTSPVNPQNVIGSLSLTLAKSSDTQGSVSINLMGFQSCNFGEPVDGLIFDYYDPSWGWNDLRTFNMDLARGVMRKDVYDRVVGYQFTCGQTG